MGSRPFLISSLLLAASVCGCGQRGETVSDPPVPVAEEEAPLGGDLPESAGTSGPQERELGGVVFVIPEDWEEVPLSGVRASILDASYRIPKAGAELEITFSSVGGGIEENINRWIDQFRTAGDEPHTETLQVGGSTATWVDVRGTFNAGMSGGGGPRDNWRLLGVAIPRSEGDYYVKLTGPQPAVADVYDEFRRFVESARP
jgi:hypothetical protein